MGEAAFRIGRGELVPTDPAWLQGEGAPGPCDALQEGLERGWPGRTLLLLSPVVSPLLFHLEGDGTLAVSAGPADHRSFGWESGDPLAAVGDPLDARIYLSSPAPPGEPDHVEEYRWDGAVLAPARRSRQFSGRLAALVFLPGDGRAALAEITGPATSLLHLLAEEDLWPEVLP